MRLRSWALGAAAVLVGAGVLAYALVPGVRWRTDLVAITATGQIEGIELSDVIHMIAPGSAVSLKGLVESRNPYRSIENPFGSAEDIAAGSQAYDRDCAKCHGESGKGATAPALNRQNLVHGDSDWSLFNTIRYGVDGSAMLAANLEEREIWSVVAYLASVRSGAEEQRLATNRIDFDPVSSEALENGRSTPQDWLTYSGAYDSQRYSELDSIHSDNASRAHIAWVHQFDGAATMHEPSPVVVAGVMYLTESPNTVHALDAQSGKRLWSYSHRNADDIAVCCGAVNRGLAIHGHTLYMGTLDSNLVALDARTGKHLWTSDLHDHRLGSSITAAPLVVGDKVIVGYGGGDMGVRSFLDAVNTSDGSLAWRFFTIPAEGEPGNETWSGDSWKTGGAATWLTGSYDPENRLLYWTTGNPAPDFQGDLREGDNLYSCSVVAINIDTGELAWHFQFTPHDEHDWDANQIPVLADRMWNGEMRRLLLLANRNGFFYVLDRDTGEFLLAEAYVKQNWALDIDEDGRPILNPATRISTKGTNTWPGSTGGTNWQSPSYSPRTGLMYVPALESGQTMFKDADPVEHEVGKQFLGGWMTRIQGADWYYSVRALNPETGEIEWEYRQPARDGIKKTSGLVSTAGDIIFGGDGAELFIIDARDGSELWRQHVGGPINAAPVTYAVDGKQYFAIAAGRAIVTVSVDHEARIL